MASTVHSFNADALPSTRSLLTSLILSLDQSLPEAEQHDISNPLINASEKSRSLLLTLHTLFPNELLPALDLLDRGLVTRFRLQQEQRDEDAAIGDSTAATAGSPTVQQPFGECSTTYYVRSAQQAAANARSKYRVDNPIYYEVHLNAWSCSCPAFAFSAFPATVFDDTGQAEQDLETSGVDHGWQFGGVTRGTDAPVCKHLLACVLIERCKMFEQMVENREVSVDEMAGWAAGWGD